MPPAVAFGLISAGAATLGLLAVAWNAEWSRRHAGLLALAAAGMLVTLTLLHIAPEAIARAPDAPAFILGGFLAGLLLTNLTRMAAPAANTAPRLAGAVAPLIAIGLHSFIDGVVYAVTFAADHASGVFAALGLILHEAPEGVIAFAALRQNGFSARGAALGAFLAAAATTPLGAAVSTPFLDVAGEAAIGPLFALSAGLLLFVATGPLMAPLRADPPPLALPAFGAGAAVAVALAAAPLGAHDHHASDKAHAAPFHAPHDAHDGHAHAH